MSYTKEGKWIDPDVIDAETRRCPRITVCDGQQSVVGRLEGTGVLVQWKCSTCGQETYVPVPGTFPPADPHELENGRDDWRILRDGSDYLVEAPDENDWRL